MSKIPSDQATKSSPQATCGTNNNQSAIQRTVSQPIAKSPAVERAMISPPSATSSPRSQIDLTDQESQLRSTLAVGQLIAINRPSAGSKLIAGELRHLTKTLNDVCANLRKEISNLSTSLASSLKTVMEDDREQRNISSAAAMGRRPFLSNLAYRRFPVYRRPRRLPPQTMRKSLNNVPPSIRPTTSPVSIGSNATAMKAAHKAATKGVSNQATAGQSASKVESQAGSMKTINLPYRHAWFPSVTNAYDGEPDSDSNDTTPSSSP